MFRFDSEMSLRERRDRILGWKRIADPLSRCGITFPTSRMALAASVLSLVMGDSALVFAGPDSAHSLSSCGAESKATENRGLLKDRFETPEPHPLPVEPESPSSPTPLEISSLRSLRRHSHPPIPAAHAYIPDAHLYEVSLSPPFRSLQAASLPLRAPIPRRQI